MASAARGRPYHPSGDEVTKAILWRIERTEFGDGAAPICDDHFLACPYAIDVLTQTILAGINSSPS